MKNVDDRTIFVTLAGSQAHGTATSSSDVDLRGVCVAPLEVRCSLFRSFEQSEGELLGELWAKILPKLQAHATARHGLSKKVESVVFDIAKFLKLCASANPNALEILFADERDWVYSKSPWERLVEERNRFLTMRIHQTYLGYATAQLKKIKTQRSWLLAPPKRKPTRAEFGLPESGTVGRDDQNRIEQALADRVRAYGLNNIDMPADLRIEVQAHLDEFMTDAVAASSDDLEERLRAVASHGLQLPVGVVQALNAEKKYRGAMKHWDAYQAWKRNRNPARAELEAKHGFDTKHGAHLVRLMRTGLEVVESGELLVRRADAEELKTIRDGAWSYERLVEESERLEERMKDAAKESTLPAEVDHDWVDGLAYEVIEAMG